MKNIGKYFVAIFVVSSLAGCVTTGVTSVAPPSESMLVGEPFHITIPKNLEDNSEPLKGVQLGSFENDTGDLGFFAVNFTSKSPDELVTSVCRGDAHSSGRKYQSCIYFDSRITVEEKANAYDIVITPYKSRSRQGRNAIFLPIGMPKADVAKWHAWVSSQEVTMKLKFTSKYGPESIKGNFDRSLKRYSLRDNEAVGTLRQFKDTYLVDIEDGMIALIGASFYPYRNGTMVELNIRGRADSRNGVTSRNWSRGFASIRAELERILSE